MTTGIVSFVVNGKEYGTASQALDIDNIGEYFLTSVLNHEEDAIRLLGCTYEKVGAEQES